MRKSSHWPLITCLIITLFIGLSPMIIAELPNKIIYLLTRDGGGVGGSGNATSIGGTNVVYTDDADINDVLFFDGTNWNVGPVTASSTNATFGVKTNGTTVNASASLLNFIYGSNVVIRTTNASGQVDIQISATGEGSSNPNVITNTQAGASLTTLTLNGLTTNNGSFRITGDLFVGDNLAVDILESTDFASSYNVDTNNIPGGIASRHIVTNIVNSLGFAENMLKIFVETNGNDVTAVLGDPSKPFRTIASAASNVVNNSVVLVGPGEFTYVPTIQTNVVLDAPLNTSIGFDLKTNVAVIGSGPGTVFTSGTNWGEFINLREVNNILFANFTVKDRQLTGPEHGTFAVTNNNWSSVRFIGTNQNIRITGVTFKDHTRQVIDHLYGPIRTTHVMVDNCWFENIGVTNVPGAVVHDGAVFVGIGTDWTLMDSTITNALRAVEPIHIRTPSDTVMHSGVKIINVRMLGIWENAISTYDHYKDFLIENCLITRLNPTTETEGYGIKLAGGGSEFTIRGNTIRGWNHAIYSETSETNLVIEGNRFINNTVGVSVYAASGDGNKTQGHVIRDNFFQDIAGPAIQIGGVNNLIEGNQFLNCKTNSTAGQGVVRFLGTSTNITLRGNIYRAYNSSDTNAFCISLAGASHNISGESFDAYKTSIYTGTAVGTTFGFNGIPVNSALAPTDGDVLTYDSATGVYTNLAATGGSGSPEGGNTQVQFNDAGSFGGLSNLMYFKASGTIQFSNNIGNGFVDFAAPVTFKSAVTNEGPLYQLFPSIGGSELIYRQPDGLLTTWSSIYDMVHTNATSTNFVTDVADIGTPASGDLIPIVDVSTAARKYVSIANLPAGSGGDTNFTVTTTDTSFITNLFITGTGPGSIILSNSTGSEFVELVMSDAGTSATNAFSWSTITPGQFVGFHDANGTLTNVNSDAAAAEGGTGSIQFAEGTSFNGTNSFRYDITNQVLHIPHFAVDSNAVEIAGGGSTLYMGPQFIGTATDTDFFLSASGDSVWKIESASAGVLKGSLLPVNNNSNDVGSASFKVRTNWVNTLNAQQIASPTFSPLAQGQVVGIHDPNGTLTNFSPGLTIPPYTVPITGTNFIINWIALGSTNDIVLTNYASAGILNTNIIPGKVIRATIVQGSQGFQTIVPNTNYFGPNWRYTSVQTGITQSTNGGYEDFIVLYGSRTNAVLSGQNWGAMP